MLKPKSAPGTRRGAWATLTSLLLLVMLPNLLWAMTAADMTAFAAGIAAPAMLLATLFAAFGSRAWICCLLLIPFALLAPLETFYIARYHHPSSADVIASVFATNSGEVTEFFGPQLPPLAFAVLGALILSVAAILWTKSARLGWRHRSRVLLLACVSVTPVALVVASFSRAHGDVEARIGASSAALHRLSEMVALGFPFGVVSRVSNYVSERNAIFAHLAELEGFRFGAVRNHRVGPRRIYVLAIGESSRRNHWQLFGYDRSTNPQLGGIADLVPINNMVASWFASIMAIPLIVTRKPITALRLSWEEPSILRVMSEAGFETHWISNQMPMGEFDSPVSMYALQADKVLFVNHAASLTDASYDEALLKPLSETIGRTRKDLFIVLHLMGSHLLYDRRYPASFTRFQPIYSDLTTDVSDGVRMNNSYDNTIVYTDHVLAETIRLLRESNSLAALLFASDHGETLPNSTCSSTGHGVGSRYDFEIPAFVWYSQAYAAAYPERIAAVHDNASQPTLSANIFESLVDMADISFPGHDTSWSLFSRDWKYHPRYVNSSVGQTNFDEAVFDDQCEQIVPAANARQSSP